LGQECERHVKERMLTPQLIHGFVTDTKVSYRKSFMFV